MKYAFPTFRSLTRNEIFLAIAFWVFLTAFSINCSYARGKLSIPVSWDDTGYLKDAHIRLQLLYDKGVAALVRDYVKNTPHSPLTTGLAFFGFILFGVGDLGPYLLNSLVVLVLIVWSLKFFKPSNPFLRWLAPAYICTIPLAGMGIIELRPDFGAGLFLALGMIATISQPFVRGTRSHLIAAGAFFGLAILAKPTFLPFIIFIWGCAVAAALLCDFFGEPPERSARGAIRSTAIHGAAMAALGLLQLAFGWRAILNYIRLVMFSSETKVWTATTQGSFAYSARYFLTGEGGMQMLGGHLWILAAWIFVGLLFLLRATLESRLRWLSLTVLILISYVFFSANIAKTPHFGLTFQILMAFAALASVQTLLDWIKLRGLPSILQYVAAALLLLPGIYFFQPWYPIRGRSGDAYTQYLWNSHEQILRVVANRKSLSPVRVYMTAVGDVNPDSLGWMAIKRSLNAEFPNCDALSADVAVHMRLIDGMDVIVVPETGAPGFYPFLVSSKISAQILESLGHDPRFIQVEKIPAMSGKSIFVWLNLSFRGWTSDSGFAESEGPYPKAHLPRVQWAMGPEARLIPNGVQAGSATISGSCLSYVEGQEMQIRVGNTAVGAVKIPKSGEFVDFSFSMILEDPSQPVTLTFATWDRADPARPMAVLFRGLKVVSQSQKSEPSGKE